MKYALVIGGTRGIGEGVVDVLLREGWRVTATGISRAEVDAFKARYSDAKAEVLDVTNQDQVTQVFAGIDKLHGLVNCAGMKMTSTFSRGSSTSTSLAPCAVVLPRSRCWPVGAVQSSILPRC